MSASAKADQALAVPVEPVSRLDPSGFDPSREATAIDRAGAALKDAYDYIRGPADPCFEAVDTSHRILALAAAMVAAEPLLAALRDIRAMKTPHANATVKRMAERAAIARGGTPKSDPTAEGGDSAGAKHIAQTQPPNEVSHEG